MRTAREPTVRIGCRCSAHSIEQATQVLRSLKRLFPRYIFEVRRIVTLGDRMPDRERDEPGMFVREIEEELRAGAIDLAVHNVKDMPSALPDGLCLAACISCADPRDALLSRDGSDIFSLKLGAVIGTSSLRRKAQIQRIRPDLVVEPLRDSLDTRIRKLSDGVYDAIIVAYAGLQGMGVKAPGIRILPDSLMLPPCGQGVIGIEARRRDARVMRMARRINDERAMRRVSCEREFLAALGLESRSPVAVHAKVKGNVISLKASLFSPDGKKEIVVQGTTGVSGGAALARRLARRALDSGASEMLKAVAGKLAF